MFASRYQTGKLDSFLERSDFEVTELFQIKNIILDIKLNMSKFVNYLKTHKSITKAMIFYMTRITQSSLQDELNQRYCYYSTEFLTNDDDALVQIYFQNQHKQEVQQDILEFEKVINNDQTKIADGCNRPHQYQILEYLLNYLLENNLQNQAYNGYFSKAVSIITKKRGQDLLKFLSSNNKQHLIKSLINGINSPSIGSLIIKILSINYQKKEYNKYEKLKHQIVKNISEIFLNNLENNQLCESIILLLQDGFQIIKNKNFEFPEDYVLCLNYFVSEQFLLTLLDKFFNGSSNEIQNVSSFLTILIKKMNIQIEDFYSNRKDREINKMKQEDFILKFQFNCIFNQFYQMLQIIKTQKFLNAPIYTKHKIFDLFLEMVKNQKLFSSNISLDYQQIILELIELLDIQSIGIFKTQIYSLIKTFIEKSPKETIINQQNLLKETYFKKYFRHLFEIQKNDFQKNNMKALIGIEASILMLLQSKINTLFNMIYEIYDIDIEEMQQRYEMILGGEIKNNKSSFEDDEEPIRFQIIQIKNSEVQQKKQPEKNIIVGKNKNITLPNLRILAESKKSKIEMKSIQNLISQNKSDIKKEQIEQQSKKNNSTTTNNNNNNNNSQQNKFIEQITALQRITQQQKQKMVCEFDKHDALFENNQIEFVIENEIDIQQDQKYQQTQALLIQHLNTENFNVVVYYQQIPKTIITKQTTTNINIQPVSALENNKSQQNLQKIKKKQENILSLQQQQIKKSNELILQQQTKEIGNIKEVVIIKETIDQKQKNGQKIKQKQSKKNEKKQRQQKFNPTKILSTLTSRQVIKFYHKSYDLI